MKASNFSFLVFFTLLIVCTSNAQEKKEQVAKFHEDENGKLFWNKNLPFYLRISSNPSDSGLLMKGEVSKSYTNPDFFDAEGINKIQSKWATNPKTKKAKVPENEDDFEIYVDGIAPVTNILYTNALNFSSEKKSFFGKGLKIEIKAKDENSGIEQIFYSLNGENFKPYTNTFNIENDGEQILKYYSVDKVGNVETTKEKKFDIDLNPPKTFYTITGIAEGQIIAASTKIYLSSKDSISGTAKIFYKIDDEVEKPYLEGNILPINHLKDGEHHLYFYSIDHVGNKETENIVPFYLDLTAPIVASDILGDRYVIGEKVFFSGRTKMKLTAVDNKAGVEDILYSVDGGEFINYNQPFYLPSIPGIHIVKYYATDKMKNNSEGGDSRYEKYKHVVNRIYVDLTGPILSSNIIGPTYRAKDTLYISNKTLIKFMAVDPESGVQFITYSLNKEPDENSYSEPIHIDNEGFQHIVYYGYDNVKNRNRSEIFVFVDKTGPEIKYNFSIVPQGLKENLPVYPQHVTLYLGATDQIIGAKEIFYSVNNAAEKKYSVSISGFIKNAVNTVNIRALDLLGNETSLELKFYID